MTVSSQSARREPRSTSSSAPTSLAAGEGLLVHYTRLLGTEEELGPYLSIEVLTKNGDWRPIDALVDSGADRSVFDLDAAAQLFGLSENELRKERATVVGGSSEMWTLVEEDRRIRARIEGVTNEFDLQPVFIPHRSPALVRLANRLLATPPAWVARRRQGPQGALLGRRDFMAPWAIVLDQHNSRMTLFWEPHKRADPPTAADFLDETPPTS